MKPCSKHKLAMKQSPEMWGMIMHGVEFIYCEKCKFYENSRPTTKKKEDKNKKSKEL